MNPVIKLIAGLGNPGDGYARTRHNVGFWFVDALAAREGLSFRNQRRFGASIAELPVRQGRVWLLKPGGYMNRSGTPVSSFAAYHDISPEQLLVCHDDLDLPPGVVRLKLSGGHGGNNGVRDVIAKLGSADFVRLRFGIGRPQREGVDHVLGKPSADDRAAIEQAIDRALDLLPEILAGEYQRAMNEMHRDPETGDGL
jgi:PTH1 family peptidyl-tRNA hydrolase